MQQCLAKSKRSGDQCRNPPMRGGKVCRMHGGAAPQVREASARRVLEEYVMPALYALREILDDEETPPQVRLAAVKDIMDRNGFKAPERVEVITMGAVEAEIERLEAQLGINDGTGT